MSLFQSEFFREEIGCLERGCNDGVQNFTQIYLVNYPDIIYLLNYRGGMQIRARLDADEFAQTGFFLARRKNVDEILSRSCKSAK